MTILASLLRALRLPAALLAIASAPAADNNLVGRPIPNFDSGLQLSVSTNAYKVYGGDVVTPVTRTRATRDFPVPRINLIASVMLANRSNSDLTFTFEDQAAASRKFNFRVLNPAGVEVWTSSAAAAAATGDVQPETIAAVLKKRTKWSSTLQIPLKIGDAWLTPGVYTLEAAIAGEPRIGATTLFEVVLPPTAPPPPDPGAGTGIQGQVLRSASLSIGLDGSVVSTTGMPMGTKATIRIVELFPPNAQTFRAPFVYEGETAADGTFKVATFPGRYRVTATAFDGPMAVNETFEVTVLPPFPPVPPQKSVTVETTVTAGEYATVRLFLHGDIIYQQPSPDTGIRGSVVKIQEGATTPVAVGGATVVVEEIRPVILEGTTATITNVPIAIRPLFRWTGKTNATGEFTVNTPPGRFRIVATVGSPIILDPVPTGSTETLTSDGLSLQLRGSAEVTVIAGAFTNVEVKVSSLTFPVGKVLVYTVGNAEAAVVQTTVGSVLRVSASGTVRTGGWSLPELRQKRVTAEGIVEFEFLAKQPTGIVTQVISPISATNSVPLPPNAKGVRVISSTNAKDVPILIPVDPPVLQAF